MIETSVITQTDCDKLNAELQLIILRIFEVDTYKIKRFHSDAEQERLQEIARILKHCTIKSTL